MEKNYYTILQVDSNADQDIIKAAHRALVKKHHPDQGGSVTRMQQINEAYEVLGNPAKRQEYDLRRAQDAQTQDAQARQRAQAAQAQAAQAQDAQARQRAQAAQAQRSAYRPPPNPTPPPRPAYTQRPQAPAPEVVVVRSGAGCVVTLILMLILAGVGEALFGPIGALIGLILAWKMSR